MANRSSQLTEGGHCPILASHGHCIGMQEENNCECDGKDDLNHLLIQCPLYDARRQHYLGPNPTRAIHWKQPARVFAFFRDIGRLGHLP